MRSVAVADPALEPPDAGGGIRVLLVHDDTVEARILAGTLRQGGPGAFVVERVGRLTEALQRLDDGTVDVVVLDLALSDAERLEGLHRLRLKAPDLPVVVLSEADDRGLATEALRRGAQDYLQRGRLDGELLARSIRFAVERSRAERALRDRFFEEDLTGDLAVRVSDGVILACNPAFVRMFGFATRRQALRCNAADLFLDRKARSELLGRVRSEGKVERFEMRGRRRDGEPVDVIGNVVGTFDAGGALLEVRAYLFDDTERKRAKQQLLQAQKMEAVGRLAGGVAHDFNNILTAIQFYSENLIQDLDSDPLRRRQAEEIKKASERAAQLTRQLLAFSRRQVLQPRRVSLNEIVSDLENMLRRVLGEDVALEVDLAPELGIVEADPGQLEQVIVNLAVNARDAMSGGGRLALRTENVELDERSLAIDADVRPGRYACLLVRDTGEGIDPETLAKIFEPFYTTKDTGKGTGLGLATVYGIVKQSGGYVTVESELGRGSTFRVYLPRRRGDTTEAEPPLAPCERPAGGSETVLVVEDEVAVRTAIAEALWAAGYEVLEADSGADALATSERRGDTIDLVLSDIVMPDIRGPELRRRLQERSQRAKVLFMSGYTGEIAERLEILQAGTPFLQKPFTASKLVRRVRQVLDS